MNQSVPSFTGRGRKGSRRPEWTLEEFRRAGENLSYVRCINPSSFHKMAYHVWGDDAARRPVIGVHGLTRHGGDFDPLARALSKTRRLICPDLVGRGASDWLPDPGDYHVPQYNCDLVTLMAAEGCNEVDWIGTSLGGLCGITMAGMTHSPIRRLVVNDVAPEVPLAALRRVSAHLSEKLEYEDHAAIEAHMRDAYAGFGPMTDTDWRHMATTSVYRDEEGHFAPHFDPEIGYNFRHYWTLYRFNLWSYWKRITCPILIVRGKDSDFLTPDLLARMMELQPSAELLEYEGVGHTPMLNCSEQIDPILNWLALPEETMDT